MKTYIQCNDNMPLMPVLDAVIMKKDPTIGLHEPVLVLRTYVQDRPIKKLVKARRRSSVRGRGSIMANKFVRSLEELPVERGEL